MSLPDRPGVNGADSSAFRVGVTVLYENAFKLINKKIVRNLIAYPSKRSSSSLPSIRFFFLDNVCLAVFGTSPIEVSFFLGLLPKKKKKKINAAFKI